MTLWTTLGVIVGVVLATMITPIREYFNAGFRTSVTKASADLLLGMQEHKK